jgi:phenylpropionate dioxygenase-like ring-hydroxylating dioxygenase large terminal subunit
LTTADGNPDEKQTSSIVGEKWEGPKVVPNESVPRKGMPLGYSQIGVHDLVPELGYREYWYPAIFAKDVGKRSWRLFGRRKPVTVKICGEDVLFFPGKNGRIAAIWNRCPHRGAIFTPKGRCEFDGTVSCPYHGYTFDETGTCVAALTEGPNSGQVGKMKVRSYPTEIVKGIVFVWMGQTEPVPIEEDVPEELFNPGWVVVPYRTTWPMNWSLTIENSGDNHSSHIHRFRLRRMLNLSAFQKIMAYWPGVKIVEQTDKSIAFRPAGPAPHQVYYPGLGKKWPQHVWFRFLNQRKPAEKTMHRRPFSHEYRLPSIARVHGSGPGVLHMRWATPIDKDSNIHFTFGIAPGRNRIQKIYNYFYVRFWYRIFTIKVTNELEDVPVQRFDRLDTTAPQKLGANDAPIIIWRRRLPLTSRDNIRVWKLGLQFEEGADKEARELEAVEEPVTSADD